jgi:hypothetical protein
MKSHGNRGETVSIKYFRLIKKSDEIKKEFPFFFLLEMRICSLARENKPALENYTLRYKKIHEF